MVLLSTEKMSIQEEVRLQLFPLLKEKNAHLDKLVTSLRDENKQLLELVNLLKEILSQDKISDGKSGELHLNLPKATSKVIFHTFPGEKIAFDLVEYRLMKQSNKEKENNIHFLEDDDDYYFEDDEDIEELFLSAEEIFALLRKALPLFCVFYGVVLCYHFHVLSKNNQS